MASNGEKTMKYIYSILAIMAVVAAVGVSGCTDIQASTQKEEALSTKETCPVQDFGNGVLYFPCTGGKFASTLSQHIESDNLTILAITPVLEVFSYNKESGYIVVVEHG